MDIKVTRLDPTLAEITISHRPDLCENESASDYELTGRFVGPRCEHLETIELAYPVRMVIHQQDVLVARVLIPEPCFWTATQPLIYDGVIELCKGSAIIERVEKALGLTLTNMRSNL